MVGSFQEALPTGGVQCLFPVVLSVPAHLRGLRGRPQVAILSRLARVAARLSARLAGIAPPAFDKDALGTPQPCGGIHWSITHKPAFVAGIAAMTPIGIDIEHIRPPSPGLYRRIASPAEWRLGQGMTQPRLFFRFWTAKEAVLKAEGVGLRGLSRCRITGIPDREKMQLAYDRQAWSVRHYYLSNHVVALTGRDEDIQWRVDPRWPAQRGTHTRQDRRI